MKLSNHLSRLSGRIRGIIPWMLVVFLACWAGAAVGMDRDRTPYSAAGTEAVQPDAATLEAIPAAIAPGAVFGEVLPTSFPETPFPLTGNDSAFFVARPGEDEGESLLPAPCDIVQVGAGYYHTVALRSEGTVWAWGLNNYGQLGDGTTTTRYTPAEVSGLTNITAIAVGNYHCLALKNDGTIWAWGWNVYGQLGDGTTTNRTTPVQVSTSTGLTVATAIGAGQYHSLAVKNDGTAWAWGYNGMGQLGNGTTTTSYTPTQMTTNNGNVLSVAACAYDSLVLKNDGSVWGCGYNYVGEIGDGTTTQRTTLVATSGLGAGSGVVKIAGFLYHSAAIKDATNSNALYMWGNNGNGQLGFGDTTTRLTPVFEMNGVASASQGSFYHTAITKTDGTVWSSGNNTYGQIGNGTGAQTLTWVQDSALSGAIASSAGGYYHSVTAKIDSVWDWGYNQFGGLGMGPLPAGDIVAGNVYAPLQASGMSNAKQISGGYYHTLVTKNDGTPWSYGRNRYGELGIGNLPTTGVPVQVLNITSIAESAAGGYHSLWRKSDGTVWAAGGGSANNFGQLGNGTTTDSWTPVQVLTSSGLTNASEIGAGFAHSLAVQGSGASATAYAWGYNVYGQLGNNTTTNSSTPVQVKDAPGTGYLTNVKTVTGGYYHSLALLNDGTVWAWGYNGYGQLGNGNTTTSYLPVQVKDAAGTGVLTGIVWIAAGGYHSMAVKNDGTVWTWGYNNLGQLGNGTTTNSSLPVQVSTSTGLTNAVECAASLYHSVARTGGGAVFDWGNNGNGQIGDGTTSSRTTPYQTSVTNATGIGAGYYHTLAVVSSNTTWGWGSNLNGQVAGGVNDSAVPVSPAMPTVPAGLTSVPIGSFTACTLTQTYTTTTTTSGSINYGWTITPPGGCTAVPATGSNTSSTGSSTFTSTLTCPVGGPFTFNIVSTAANTCGTSTKNTTNALTCLATNNPPTCNAGGPYSSTCKTASINGATAQDPDGDALTYTWASSNPNVTLSPASGNIGAGSGARPVPTSTATLASSVNPCNVSTTLTLTVTDPSGQTGTSTATLTFNDTIKPTLNGVPANTTVECSAVPAPAPVTVTDNCDTAPKLNYQETKTPGNCADNYTLTRTWTGSDVCGNTQAQSQVITVQDKTPPVLSGVGGNVTVECDSVPPPTGPTATDNCDPAPVIQFTEVRTDGNCPYNYTLTRTWTAIDRCSNSSAQTQIVTVQDTKGPVLDYKFEPVMNDEHPDEQIDGLYRASYTGKDNCDPAPEIKGFVDVYGNDETCDDETPDFLGYPVQDGDLVQLQCGRKPDCLLWADAKKPNKQYPDLVLTITGPAFKLAVTGMDVCTNKSLMEGIMRCPNPEGCIDAITLRNSKGDEKTFYWYEFSGGKTLFDVGGETGVFKVDCSKCLKVGDVSGTLTITCIQAGEKMTKKCKLPEGSLSTPCP
jgi:alpha-tubulin suppressor-like RCC1 family protein